MLLKDIRFFDDLDLKIRIGSLEINILYIHFMPANPKWIEKNHSHTTYELHFIPCGKGTLITNNMEYQISPGTFYLTGPDIYHEQRTNTEQPMEEYCINFEIKHCKTQNHSEKLPKNEVQLLSNVLLKTNFWFGSDEYNCLDLFERIYTELEEKWIGYYIAVKNYIFQIIINAVRCYMLQKRASYNIPHKTLYENRIRILDNYLYLNYSQPITVDTLANKIGVSRRQLHRIIQQYYHTTFKEKLTRIRIENAKNLLLTTTFSIEKIAEKVGFSSGSHLSKTFKRLEQISPYKFRRRM